MEIIYPSNFIKYYYDNDSDDTLLEFEILTQNIYAYIIIDFNLLDNSNHNSASPSTPPSVFIPPPSLQLPSSQLPSWQYQPYPICPGSFCPIPSPYWPCIGPYCHKEASRLF